MNKTSILKILTEFTALTSNGIVVLKPFRAFSGYPNWQNRKIGLRVLNAGETAEAMEYINTSSGIAQDIELKIEIVSRSLWSVDGSYVANKEDLDIYNENHKSDLDELDYKRIMVRNFEYPIVDHLYNTYNDLQKKQTRKIYGISECAVTKQIFTNIPEGSKILLYNTSEIICPTGLSKVVPEDNYDFDNNGDPVTHVKPDVNIEKEQVSEKPPVKSQVDFDSYEEYQNYLLSLVEENEKKSV